MEVEVKVVQHSKTECADKQPEKNLVRILQPQKTLEKVQNIE